MSPATWYLDVDGVVNCLPAPTPAPTPPVRRKHGPFERVMVDGQVIYWSPSVVDATNAVSRDRLANIVWLTSWGQKAATLLAPAIGLDGFEVAVAGREQPRDVGATSARWENWWKWQLLADRHGTGESRLVWVDDDIDRTFRNKARDLFGSRALLVRTSRSPGLRLSEVDTIRHWLVDHADT